MGRESVVLAVVLGALVTACSERGTIVGSPDAGGTTDTGDGHDVTFVPQVDGDGGDDAPMEWDGADPDADEG